MTDTDRTLLEKAARAAGLNIEFHETFSQDLRSKQVLAYIRNDGPRNQRLTDLTLWAPLTDDGDALRLASKLRLLVDFSSCCAMNLRSADDDWFGGLPGDERIGCSPAEFDGPAVVRRAIVRAAASLGEQHDQ